MFSHVVLGANDIAASKAFYNATISALGGTAGMQDPKGRVFYMHNGGALLITQPIDGNPATGANGGTVGFAAANGEQVEAWHAAGLAAGGTSIEDAPGVRETEMGGLYLAYLRDPAGNKVCAMYRVPA